jgi:hypothetical protein
LFCEVTHGRLPAARKLEPVQQLYVQLDLRRAITKARRDGVMQTRFPLLDLRAYYATRHKAQYGDLPGVHAQRVTTGAVYDRSKKAVRKSVD